LKKAKKNNHDDEKRKKLELSQQVIIKMIELWFSVGFLLSFLQFHVETAAYCEGITATQ
jgi:hypothetical protein